MRIVLALLVALVALVPALVAFVRGRRLVAMTEDPALPERLLEHRRILARVVGVAVALVVLLAPGPSLGVIPLMLLLLLLGSFPARKALLEESWSLGAYLSHMLRLSAAGIGFWALVAATPALVLAAGQRPRPTMAALGLALLAWSLFHADVFLALARATPLQSAELEPIFTPVFARAHVARPRLRRAGTPGGRWVNALTLPSLLRRPAVLFSDTVLAMFAPDELGAILAHEVAHLEHYQARRRRIRSSIGGAFLIALALGLVPACRRFWPEAASVLPWMWVLITVGAIAGQLARHKSHEAESDRRAVELCGDPEALVRALVKLHSLARMPRRWGADFERSASHPSLAHRIQAIRAAGAASAETRQPLPTTVIASEKPGTYVVLEQERAHWLEGVPPGTPEDPAALRESATVVRSVVYGELAELRVRAGVAGPASLAAADRAGQRWSVPLGPAAVARAQAALDEVDERLSPARRGSPGQRTAAVLVSAGAFFAAMFSANVGPVLLPALVGTFRPGPVPLAATGATALAGAVLALGRTPPPGAELWVRAGAIVLLALGLLALGLAISLRSRSESHETGALATLALLGLAALVAWSALGVAVAFSGGALRIHQAAQGLPSAAVTLFGLAAALALVPRPRWRVMAVTAAALGTVPLLLASPWFLERFGDDPLLVARPPVLAWRAATVAPVQRARVEGAGSALRVSPSGRAWAVGLAAYEEEEQRGYRFRLGRFSGPTHEVEAADVAFVDDERALALVPVAGGLELCLLAQGADAPLWRRALPALEAPQLAVNPATGAWRVGGAEPRSGALVRLEGTVGADDMGQQRWPSPPGMGPPSAFASGSALVVRSETDLRFPWMLLLAPQARSGRFDLWVTGAEGARVLARSQLDVRCPPPPFAQVSSVCLAHDGERTLLWSVGARGGLEPLGSIPGRVWFETLSPESVLAAWSQDGVVIWADLATRQAFRLSLAGVPSQAVALVPARGRLAAILPERGASVIAVFEIP